MRRFDRRDKETAQRFQRRAKCAGEKPHKGALAPTAVFRRPRALLRPQRIQSCYVQWGRTTISKLFYASFF
jgi:hypothetical protein